MRLPRPPVASHPWHRDSADALGLALPGWRPSPRLAFRYVFLTYCKSVPTCTSQTIRSRRATTPGVLWSVALLHIPQVVQVRTDLQYQPSDFISNWTAHLSVIGSHSYLLASDEDADAFVRCNTDVFQVPTCKS